MAPDASTAGVAAIVAEVRREVRALVPEGALRLTGASSIPGTVTRGDIDLHLRVPAATMPRAVELLGRSWQSVHRTMWTDGLATFERTMAGRPVGVAVTVAGGEHDRRFEAAWRRLRRDPDLLARYESMKRVHDGADERDYLEAKGRFFSDLERRLEESVDEPRPRTSLPPVLGPAALEALAVLGIERLEDAGRWPRAALGLLEGIDDAALAMLDGLLIEHGLAFRAADAVGREASFSPGRPA